jgi:hypothetical protein
VGHWQVQPREDVGFCKATPHRFHPLVTRCDRRQVDTWAAHEPGDVVRVTVERQYFEGAEDDNSTAAYLSFDDLLSAGVQSTLWHLLACLRCD